MQPDESSRTFRNHPSVIVGYMLSVVIFVAVIAFGMLRDTNAVYALTDTALVVGAILVIVFLWSYFYWKRTFYIFTETELHVTRTAIAKSDKHIQYTRLASVNVTRTFLNRVFGTSTLTFNVNSSMNATKAEATLVLNKDMADRLRNHLNSLIFEKSNTIQDDVLVETLVTVSNEDVIVHAVFGQPTYQAIFGLLMLFYAVVMMFYDNSGGLITAIILLVFSEVVPFVQAILKYYNYRIFRVGDTVTVESGLITTTRSSFKINKVNSVRIREPLLARIIGKAMLEAEVVGMASDENNIPLLCPLKRKGDVRRLLNELVPELVFESDPVHQPRRALIPMLIADVIYAAVVIAVFLGLLFTAEYYLDGMNETWALVIRATEAFLAVMVPVLIFGRSGLAQRHRTFDMGRDSFMFVYGSYDTATEYINYDKVQYVEVTSGPLQRVFGVGTCSVHMMSSIGYKQITSGLFPPEDLERVSGEVMARIRDGRYDYRRYY